MKFSEIVKSLFIDYNDELRRFVSRKLGNCAEAEEIVQDAFYNYLQLDETQVIDNPRAFLYKTANNLALNHIRKSGYRTAHLNTLETETQSPSLEREVFAQRDIDLLQQSIDVLPELTKTIFLMNRIEAKTYPEIAKELNITLSNVQKHILKALHFLRDKLEWEY